MTTIMIIGILPAGIQQHIKAESGFIANPTNNTTTCTASTDPNYNIYQNLALGFSIKYLKNMTINQGLVNRTANTPDYIVRFQTPLGKPYSEHIAMMVSVIPETNFLGQPYNLNSVK
jgi:hypothetical protein